MGRRRKRTPKTRVFVVQDKSGSMDARRDATIDGFNEYLTEVSADAEGDVTLSLVQFNTRVNNRFTDLDIDDVEDLTREDFVPGGLTALYDAVGRAIRDAEKVVRRNDNVIVVVMTDGGENASREYTQSAILKLIEEKREDDWDFVFLGAGEESWAAGQALGFQHSQTLYYGQAAHTHNAAYSALADATVNKTRRGGAMAFDASVKNSIESQ